MAALAAAGARDESVLCTLGSAAETLAREASPIVAVSGVVATLGICAVGAVSSASSTFGTAVVSLAAADEVIVEFHVGCVVTLVSDRDLPLRCCRGAVAGEGSDVGSFDVIGSESEGAVDGASDVVCASADVEDSDGESVEADVGESRELPVLAAVLGASDVVCASADVEDLDGESVEADVCELVEVPDDESDDESGDSARATPFPESTATPTPSVMIRPANRPMPRTASLRRISRTLTSSTAKNTSRLHPNGRDGDDRCANIGLEDSATPLRGQAVTPSGDSTPPCARKFRCCTHQTGGGRPRSPSRGGPRQRLRVRGPADGSVRVRRPTGQARC